MYEFLNMCLHNCICVHVYMHYMYTCTHAHSYVCNVYIHRHITDTDTESVSLVHRPPPFSPPQPPSYAAAQHCGAPREHPHAREAAAAADAPHLFSEAAAVAWRVRVARSLRADVVSLW